MHALQGSAELDKREALRLLLERSSLAARVAERADALGKPLSELRILVKTTFMLGYDGRHREILTDPDLLDELARFLTGLGVGDVAVGDGRNIYDLFCENRDVRRVAAYFGIASDAFRVVDLTEDQIEHRYPRGMGQHTLSRSWRDADFRIVFAKLRSHPVDFTHLTLGAIQGIGARLEEFLFLERAAHRDTALLMPLTEFPPDFALIDGYESAAVGLVGIIACPRFPRPHRLYAGGDALAVDMVATRHLGLPNPRDSYLLDAACHWFGDPARSTTVEGQDEPVPGWRSPYANELTTLLSLLANPVYRLLSARGSTFLPPIGSGRFPAQRKRGCLSRESTTSTKFGSRTDAGFASTSIGREPRRSSRSFGPARRSAISPSSGRSSRSIGTCSRSSSRPRLAGVGSTRRERSGIFRFCCEARAPS